MIVVVVTIVLQDRTKMYVALRLSNCRCGTAVFGKKGWGDRWLGIATMFHRHDCGTGQQATLAVDLGVCLSVPGLRIFERLEPSTLSVLHPDCCNQGVVRLTG
jgi:hypothetical protein